MQFLFLLLFNVFLGAVLYLVISLKLERSATEFRERRLRKEMDEIIKEFNMTAERNISILESRIGMLRKLLERTGDIKSLDITMAGEESDPLSTDEEKETAPRKEHGRQEVSREDNRTVQGQGYGENSAGSILKKGLLILFNKIIHILQPPGDNMPAYPDPDGSHDAGTTAEAAGNNFRPAQEVRAENAGNLIEKDLRGAVSGPPAGKNPLTEVEIAELAALADDRYQLVTILFERGCAIEDISRYSGIPAGEVRLVLNLNLNRETLNGSN
jgi:hypothetical protein